MADGGSYVDRQKAADSYRPKGYGMSPGLRRARRPFLVSNIVTGSLIALFVTGIWAYSIRAVRQDVFDDVDEEARALTPELKRGVETVEERARKVEEKLKAIASERTAKSTPSAVVNSLRGSTSLSSGDVQRGLLPKLWKEHPAWYDPNKPLVWGAPSVDNMGRIGDRTSSSE
ncbi:SubName: Full=Uncharacterized protein {ECO:0000313/EMBL:CCA75201.1} [Serendipita indica DSM 11827]|uniref:Cytochrome c oxidase assembly factor 3 n=1 Tax=Serendipita indica (strain DSM 11827) TaxID=1109443 RepID=G4TV58_SERID|nr:SubName: Full=Uncharacterized protein {ECO:0000313/EMBL:CCA75201.1} [Serendipita indica DSM 11827]CCA75201.1 hypothetical protein PIIN_09185 [Serendipita indica DSM 11827]